MTFLKLSLVYPNKWRMYMEPLIKDTPDALEFNWFLCSKPYRDGKGNFVIEVNRYSSYFDISTGKSYHVTFDATETGPCLLFMTDHKENIEKYTFDQKDDNVNYNLSTSLGYCGIAKRLLIEKCERDLICEEAVFFFNSQVVEESKICPYIEYAKTHASYLRKTTLSKTFPSKEVLIKMRPGKESLKIRKILQNSLAV